MKDDVRTVVQGCNLFALDFYRRCSAGEGNFFCSPSSIALALAMTFVGARGKTAQEMATALHFALPPDRLHEAFRELQVSMFSSGSEFRLANRLWGQVGYHFLPEFLRTTRTCYGADLQVVDFIGAHEAARTAINEWVEQQTAHKIKDLIPAGMLDSMTRLVLTNAIYFLGTWESTFEKFNTKPAEFWTASGDAVRVSMMRQKEYFKYAEFEDHCILEMPYRRRFSAEVESYQVEPKLDMAMAVLLPRERSGLKKIESTLLAGIDSRLALLADRPIDVQVPRFRIESAISLIDALSHLGIREAFTLEADFSGMTDNPEGLYIAGAFHKAFVDVDEEGTEAAAATAVIMAGRGAGPTKFVTFTADHPFVFVIRNRSSGLIHFVGRVSNPNAC